jgi:hypothetical protein
MKTFICAGQSNMAGTARRADFPIELQCEQNNLIFDNTWTPSVLNETHNGPEISFAHQVESILNEPVGIIKLAFGATTLANDWGPDCPNFKQKRRGQAPIMHNKSLYNILINKVNEAQKRMDIDVVGMIWLHGESDSIYFETASQYKDNLTKFITSIRADLQSPNMAFVTGTISTLPPPYVFDEHVRKALLTCNMPLYECIDCDSNPKGDNLHYTGEGIIQIGYDFADAMLDLL